MLFITERCFTVCSAVRVEIVKYDYVHLDLFSLEVKVDFLKFVVF